jgi:branched-chain amino acid transport system substrate-binding protein
LYLRPRPEKRIRVRPKVVSTEECMRLFPAMGGLKIPARTAAVCAAFVVLWALACPAQQNAPESATPDLTIDLPAPGPKPAPAKPVPARPAPAKPAPAKPEEPAAAPNQPDGSGADVTIVGGEAGGALETPAPEPGLPKPPAKRARKIVPAAAPVPEPAPGAQRTPTPLDAAPAPVPAAPEPAQAAPQQDKIPTPYDQIQTPVPAAPAQVRPKVPAAPALAAPTPAAPVQAKSQAPSAAPAKPAPKDRPVRAEDARPAAQRRLGEMTVGALLPLTGKNQARGQAAQAALELAKQDIGDYFAKVNAAGGFAIQIEDTQSDPKIALERLKGLLVRGIRVVIGPDFDEEIAEVRDFAKANGMLLLSPGSAGPFLTKKEGELYRFAPMNTHQSEAVAGLAAQEGVDALVPIWEGDLYGDELVVHLKAHFRNMGGTVLAGVRYRLGAGQFASYLADLKAQIGQAQKQFKKIAVYYAGREGIAEILKEAAPLGLTAYHWYGCDATALSPEMTREEAGAELAQGARLVSPRYGETETDAYAALEKRIQDKTKEFPAPECVVAYDIAWLVAINALACGGLENFDAFRAALPATAERFHGVSGWMALDDNGDRREDWGYDFWMIKKDKDRYYWEKFARYQFQPGGTKQFYINNPE